jgi:TM2 domain-containing membrane protein YozV
MFPKNSSEELQALIRARAGRARRTVGADRSMKRSGRELDMATQAVKGANEKFCFECGSAINAKAEICPRCGVRQHAPPSYIGGSTGGKNRIAAALFALLLGGVGIHKFYLGLVGQGILYLLFCWTFIPAVIGFIEGIVYLTQSDASFEEKYVNIPTDTTRPDAVFPLFKHELVTSPRFKTIMMAIGAFLLTFALFKAR